MQEINFIFAIAILIMSVVIHELSHSYTAYALGDSTAKEAGRLTLNPLKHLDFFGSIIMPLLTYFTGGFIFGWAKPVPYNPYNLRNQRWGPAIVAIAGPASNLFVASVFGLIIRSGALLSFLLPSFFEIAILIVYINIILGIFNLVPIPPLDGSKVLFSLLPYRRQNIEFLLEQYGLIIVLIFIFFFSKILIIPISLLFKLLTGIAL